MILSKNIYIVKFNEYQFSYARYPSIHLDFKKYFILMNFGESDILTHYNKIRGIFNKDYCFWTEMGIYEQIRRLY